MLCTDKMAQVITVNVDDNVRENYILQDGCVQESIVNDPMMLYLLKATSPFPLL